LWVHCDLEAGGGLRAKKLEKRVVAAARRRWSRRRCAGMIGRNAGWRTEGGTCRTERKKA
jgi:hypothetical protein